MVGKVYELSEVVRDEHTAKAMGSGLADVFATPLLIAIMEGAAAYCIAPELDEGFVSVGTHVNVQHLAATPVGMRVTAKAEVIAENGKLIEFRVTAYDEAGLIGEGTHTRAVVNLERFEEKARQKADGVKK